MRITPGEDLISVEEAKALLSYNQETGELHWRVRVSASIQAGTKAGCLHRDGYEVVKVRGRMYQSHRLAWLIARGAWPLECLDHINGVRSDNRMANLRECSHFQNMQNIGKATGRSSRFIGVTFHAGHRRWSARVSFRGVRRNIGYFETEEEAFKAYCAAKESAHTFHPKPTRGAANANGCRRK